MSIRTASWLPLALVASACTLGPDDEMNAAQLFECVRGNADYCAVCAPAATDTAAELSAGCAAIVKPSSAPDVRERTGTLALRLSGQVRARVLGSDRVVDELREADVRPLALRARAIADGTRIGIVLDDPVTMVGGVAPRLAPVEPRGGRVEGTLTVSVDYGDLGNASLARSGNVRSTRVNVSFRLMRGNQAVSSLGEADRLEGQVTSFAADSVTLTKPQGLFGAVTAVDLRLHGPASLALDAVRAPRPAEMVGTAEWRSCMRDVITRDCCVPPAVFADAVRLAGLPRGLTAPSACSESTTPAAPAPRPAPTPRRPVDLGTPPARHDARLTAGSEDLYAMTLPSPGRFVLETTTGPRDDDSATDTKLELWGPGETAEPLAADDDGSTDGAGARIELDLAPGAYRVRVTGHEAASSGPYTLSVLAAGEPAPDEPAAPDGGNAPYAVVGTKLACESNSAEDVACWNDVYRQVLAGTGLRGRTLRTVSWDLDTVARQSESLEMEIYLIHGVGPHAGSVLDETRWRVPLFDALEQGACREDGQAITCTVDYGRSLVLPEEGADWFILEVVGRDDGEIAPDGSPACGRYPHRVAGDQYRDESVNLGGYLQIHDWASAECAFDYSVAAVRPDLDLGARITVE